MTPADRLLAWFDRHGRHDLPWQVPRTPYRVWLSEIMLQQTQVSAVKGYFQRFVDALPQVRALAAAPPDQVLALWSGLGYYSRARNLQRAAQQMVERHGGELPDRLEALLALPGIGRSTAGAILAQAFGQRAPILDGNVKRVLARLDGVDEFPGKPAVERALWARADALLPERRMPDYTQALMDLGATVCTPRRPRCTDCPWSGDCVALATGRTHELPVRKPRKAIPVQQRHWLYWPRDAGDVTAVLLERRPPSGIWGGLWALPEDADLARLAARFGLDPAHLTDPMPLRHVFTHFELQATVWTVGSTAAASGVREAEAERWCARGEALALGLPAPVRSLLAARLRAGD